MTKTNVIAALAALAQETRLDIFRLLVERGPEGMPAGEIGDRLKLPSPTLSFHLNQLRHTGLVTSRRQSRLIIYGAKFRTMNSLIEYLTENCCAAQADRVVQGHSSTAMKPIANSMFSSSAPTTRPAASWRSASMNRWGAGKFHAFSAGSKPRGDVHPITLQVLNELKYETEDCGARTGTNSPSPTARRLILFSPSATAPPPRSARHGRASR